MPTKLNRTLERVCLGTGIAFLIVFAAALADGVIVSHLALAQFAGANEFGAETATPQKSWGEAERKVDPRLWSRERAQSYLNSVVGTTEAPMAVVHLGRLGIRVPVFSGTG